MPCWLETGTLPRTDVLIINCNLLHTAVLLRFVYLLLLLVLTPVPGVAQVNTEAMRVAGDRTGFQGAFSLTGNVDAGNTSVYEIAMEGRLDYLRPTNRMFIVYNYEYGYEDAEAIKNEAFIALRNTWQWKPRLAVEAFVQQQQNEFIRLKDRKLIGGGVRITAVDVENAQSDWRFRTFLGVAAMAEREVIDATTRLDRFVTNLTRSTNYLSVTLGKGEAFYLSAVQYLQFVPDATSDYRYLADVNLETRLYGSISMLFSLSYRLDNEPPAGVGRFDLSYTTGLRYRF